MKKIRLILLSIFELLFLIVLVGCDEITTTPVGVRSVEKTATEGLTDTYTITFTDLRSITTNTDIRP